MTPEDDGAEARWDDARVALRQCGQLFKEREDIAPERLREEVANYETIPQAVRETLEGLTADERRVLNKVMTTLEENHFYLENPRGGLEPPY